MKFIFHFILPLFFLYLINTTSMAAINYITSVTERGNDDKASIAVPGSTQIGDVLITQVVIRNRSGSDSVSFESGWNLIASQDQDSDVLQSLYYKVATAADAGASYEWDFAGNGSRRYILGMTVLRGVDNTNPIAAENSSTAGDVFYEMTAPSVTTVNANSYLLAAYALEAGNQVFYEATGMSENYDVETSNNSNGLTAMMARESFSLIGATGVRIAGVSKDYDDGIAHLIAFNEGALAPTINSITTNCSGLTSIIVNFSEPLEINSAQNTTNYSLVNAASSNVAITAASLSTNAVTLSFASTLKDLTSYTLTVNNVENLAGTAIALNSTDSFSLSCELNCITDNFVGPGSLSDSWSVGSSSGSFGNPTIISNGRLRLTDASSDVSTVATLLNQFPGSENKIEIEFDYYGYDGSGADGIAVNFSDASITPSAGAFGGSLGYAQKTGINGFAGGWLGVGIDEYGNFSTSGEGRVGGGGSRIQDSISLRGSGSGTSGYPFLIGTGSLSPGIDQSGSTPNPGHRYKITIDHTAGGGVATVSVQRNTGSGYNTVISEFNVYALNPSQAAVPENWVVSFTGSTGGSSNIHEIGDLKVCAAQPIQTFSIVDHYDISHTNPGLTCEGSQVTITAHDKDHAVVNVLTDTSIAVTTTPSVSAIVATPVTMLAGTSSANFYLQQTSLLNNIDIDVTDGDKTDDEGTSEDPRISFVDAAFRFYANGSNTDTTPINTQISGKPSFDEAPNNQDLTLRAVRTNTDTKACEAAVTGTKTVSFAYTCIDPNSCSATQLAVKAGEDKGISGTNTGAALSYTDLNMAFNSDGSAPFSFTFPDAGKIQLHASLTIPAASPNPAFTLIGSSNEFVVRPFGFDLVFPAGYDAADAGGSSFVKAGNNFPVQIRAVNWQSVDDVDNDGFVDVNSASGVVANLSDNSVTVNFGKEISGQNLIFNRALELPSSGALGNFTSDVITAGGAGSHFSNGLTPATNSTSPNPVPKSLNWSEVGIIDISAELNSYLATSGANIKGQANNIGRFYPDHFALTSSNLTDSCGSFSYMGQPNINISYILEARNSAGAKTANYHGAFAKMSPNDHVGIVAENNNEGVDYQGRLNNFSSTSAWMNGTFDFSDMGSFSRGLVKPEGPYSNIRVGIKVTDDNEDNSNKVLLSGLDMKATTSTNCIALTDCDAKRLDISDDLDIRFGQLKLSNVFGPETSDLDMAVRTEYYDGSGFVVNINDSCTKLLVSDPPLTPSNWTDNLALGETTPTWVSDISSGLGVIRFTKSNIGNEGSVDYEYAVDNWLKIELNGGGDYDDNPKGKVTFGQFRGNDRMIYWREIVR